MGPSAALPPELLAIPGVAAGRALAPLTSLRVGGPADAYLETDDLAALTQALSLAAGTVPVTALGRGTNLLIADAGVRGLVVRWRGEDVEAAGTSVVAGAGLEGARLATRLAGQGLAALEFAAGIPGTVGGAAVNNAGAFGSDFAAVVRRVRGLTMEGHVLDLEAAALAYGYRTSSLRSGVAPRCILTHVELGLEKGEPAEIRRRITEIARRRRESQPVKNRSVGSVFKNPPGDFAGRLVEQAGLKGRRRGRAEVSAEHANFIVNLGGASADDVRGLIEEVREEVARTSGVELEPEVEMVGEWA